MLIGIAMTALANDVLNIQRGAFGLEWGMSYADIKARHPSAAPAPGNKASVAIKGGFDMVGLPVDVIVLGLDLQTTNLQTISFGIQPKMQNEFVQELTQSLGQPKHLGMKDGKVYSHVLEWSNPEFGVSATLATNGPEINDPPGGHPNSPTRGHLKIPHP